jgi:hypothetical protein
VEQLLWFIAFKTNYFLHKNKKKFTNFLYFVRLFIIRGLDNGPNPKAEYLEYEKIISVFNFLSYCIDGRNFYSKHFAVWCAVNKTQ